MKSLPIIMLSKKKHLVYVKSINKTNESHLGDVIIIKNKKSFVALCVCVEDKKINKEYLLECCLKVEFYFKFIRLNCRLIKNYTKYT